MIKEKSLEERKEKLLDMVMEEMSVLDRIVMNERKKALKEGMEKGLNKAKIKIAKEMLKEKIDIDKISKCTEVSISELEKIQKEFEGEAQRLGLKTEEDVVKMIKEFRKEKTKNK